jgi:hypothetical protein
VQGSASGDGNVPGIHQLNYEDAWWVHPRADAGTSRTHISASPAVRARLRCRSPDVMAPPDFVALTGCKVFQKAIMTSGSAAHGGGRSGQRRG